MTGVDAVRQAVHRDRLELRAKFGIAILGESTQINVHYEQIALLRPDKNSLNPT